MGRLRGGAALAGLLASSLAGTTAAQETVAFVGATLWDGTGAPPVPDATLVVREGRVVAVGRMQAPAGARVEDVSGRWIVPGLVDAHAHVTGSWAPEGAAGEAEQVEEELRLYARYGVTTVTSLGDEPREAFRLRQGNGSPGLDRARVYVAGPVVAASTPAEARAAVAAGALDGPDWIKIRVDDNLGTIPKMPPQVYAAIIAEAHARGLRVASHLFYLEDAKGLLREGVDLVAHSIRDLDVDDEVVGLFRERGVCYVPTLVREVSTFVYADRPSFFDDPFFREGSDPREVARVSTPEFRQATRESPAAAGYRDALVVAKRNLARLAQAGVPIAFGTDAGPPARFPGYFEHIELELMVEAGLTPEQALRSATSVAAACLGLDEVGSLEPGRWADFLVLGADPLGRIEATRVLERVYVAGNRVR